MRPSKSPMPSTATFMRYGPTNPGAVPAQFSDRRGQCVRQPGRCPGQRVEGALLRNAVEHIDILVYGGTFLFDGLPRFTKILAAATKRGVAVRLIIGDAKSTAVAQRGEEERIGAALAARCQMTLARLQPLSDTPAMEIRTHTTPLYTSMFRADDTLIANPHLYGAPASDNPAIVIKRDDAPDLWNNHNSP